jgi:signal transduction histidine kinase
MDLDRSAGELGDPRDPADIGSQEVRLEELVDRKALNELCSSVYDLFGIPVRVYSEAGTLMADANREHELCSYINTFLPGRGACAQTVLGAKSVDPPLGGESTHPCFSGQEYRIVSIEYDARQVGRIILGPYAISSVTEPPPSLYATVELGTNNDDQRRLMDRDRARSLLARVPHVRAETVTRISTHLKASLDLILFSGHKALLTSQMHLMSVRESYRELQDKNARLQEAYDRLRELDRLKSNFLATVSHELRTPLTSIIGYSEMLAEGIAGELQGEQLEFVKTIHEKGEQLLQLIMSLLDLSKLESGTMAMKKSLARIGPVLNEVNTTLTPTARKKGVALIVDVPELAHDLRADPERLRQVFINLVDNALKFTPSGGSVTMTARLVEGGTDDDDDGDGRALLAPARQEIEVRVADTGMGIPPRERSRVFDPFYQVDSSSTREFGGTGLGLSIVKRLVEAHQGTIRIEGNEPSGAIFIVRLPTASSAAVGNTIPPVFPGR